MTTQDNHCTPIARRLGQALLIGSTLAGTMVAVAAAPHRGPDFPIAVSEARAKADARFQTIDQDGDAVISRAEFDAAPSPREERREKWQARREAADAELFAALDSDGDGQLSASEFDTARLKEARRDARREHMFERLDRNGDGVLSRDELPDPASRLKAMDADGDGLVSQAEAEAARQARQGKAE